MRETTALRKSLPLQRNGKGVYEYEPQSKKDTKLQSAIATLEEFGSSFEDTKEEIKSLMGMGTGGRRATLARIVYWITPSFLRGVLPEPIQKLMLEYEEPLEAMERYLRERVDNTQTAVMAVADSTFEEKKNWEEFKKDLDTAIAENWDAQRLQNYMAEKAGIEVYDQVANLLAEEFSVLSEEEREERKHWLLEQIKGNIRNKEGVVKLLGGTSTAGLRIFHYGLEQYYSFTNIYKPAIEIRKAAQGITELNASMFAAMDTLCLTFDQSVQAMLLSLQTLKLYQEYNIASPKMARFIEEEYVRIEKELEELKAHERARMAEAAFARETPALTEGTMKELPLFNTAEREEVPVALRNYEIL